MNKRVLITGAMGYVGGRISNELISSQDSDLILATRGGKIPMKWHRKQVTCFKIDWSSDLSLKKACEKVDTVVHLAAMNEIDSIKNPAEALDVNGVNSLRLLEAAKHSGIKRFIYMSTAHIYGSPLSGFIDEKTFPKPIHPYAISHRVAEDYVKAANDTGVISGVILRLSNSFGVPAHSEVKRWSLLVNDLCKQAVTTRQLKLNSSGTQQRDFITLNNVARAVKHVIYMPKKNVGDGVFNLGGGWSPSIYEMACLVAERCHHVFGFSPEIIRPDNFEIDKNLILSYNIDKLISTGFNIANPINQEIDDTLIFCKKLFKNAVK